MSTAVPSLPLQLGQLVRQRTDPAGTVGFVAGLLFVETTLVLVRWDGGGSSFDGVLAGLDRLLAHAGAGDAVPAAAALVGTDDHRIRLTLCQVWRCTGDARAGAAWVEAQRALFEAADAITDAALRQSFLTLIPENREIAALLGEPARLA